MSPFPEQLAHLCQARTLIGVNPFGLETLTFDGDSIGDAYKPHLFTGELPDISGEGLKVYTGGCHCGAVTLAVKTKPLSDVKVNEDNCSICARVNMSVIPYLRT
jgi:hypothetical protein